MVSDPLPPTRPEPVPHTAPLWERLLQSRYARVIKNFVVLPLIGTLISGMVIGRIVDTFIGSKEYFVYVVGDDSDASTSELMKEAAAKGDFKSKRNNITIKTDRRNELGDPEKAQSIAKELVRRPDVLMVVGHGSSSSSQKALPIYLQADPPIPVILTTETNPNLSAQNDDRVPPVFRLFPTDDNQAKVAACFIAKQNPKSVWIVEDASNPTYSRYLAKKFLEDVYDKKPSLKVVLWSNNLNLPPYAVDKLGIDWVFFAGDWRNALVLIRQLQAMQGTKKAKVLLSDASADKLLLRYGEMDVQGVYLLHPLSADAFNKTAYKVVGAEAYELADALIAGAHQDFEQLATDAAPIGYRLRRWLGLRRVSDERRALAGFMEKSVRKQTLFSLTESQIRMFEEDRLVIRKNASFHVWRIDNNSFIEDHTSGDCE